MKSQPLKNGMTPLIQLRRSWWTITTCLREVIYWKGSTKSNSQTLTCYCSEWRRTPSGFYFGTAQAEWFWGWLDVSQLHFLNVFIPKTFLCLLHTPFGIRSPRYWWWFRPGRSWYWISPTSLVVAQTLGYESWRHQLRCRLRGDDTNLGGWSWGVPPTWQVFKFTRLLQGLRSLRIIRFIGGLRVLVYSMFLDEFWSKMTGARGWFKSECWGICVLFGCFWGLPSITSRWSHAFFGQQKRVETNYSLNDTFLGPQMTLPKSLPCKWRDQTTASNCSIWKDTGEIRTAHKHLVLIHQDPVIYGGNIVIAS